MVVDNPLLAGWTRVRWDAGESNSYETGAHGLYALNVAVVAPGPPKGLRVVGAASSSSPISCSSLSCSSIYVGGDEDEQKDEEENQIVLESCGVELHWQPPSDPGEPTLTAYRIYRDDILVHTTASAAHCRFSDRGVTPGSTHTYTVAAVNVAGEGALTGPVEAYVAYPQDKIAVLKLCVTGACLLVSLSCFFCGFPLILVFFAASLPVESRCFVSIRTILFVYPETTSQGKVKFNFCMELLNCLLATAVTIKMMRKRQRKGICASSR